MEYEILSGYKHHISDYISDYDYENFNVRNSNLLFYIVFYEYFFQISYYVCSNDAIHIGFTYIDVILIIGYISSCIAFAATILVYVLLPEV